MTQGVPALNTFDSRYREWRVWKTSDVDYGASGPSHGSGGTEIYRGIVPEHRLLAQQERDSERESALVRTTWSGVRHSSGTGVDGHERSP